jgi:catechol 2,3-dioxygenase-like lactoylglutathione lyase family enzyme
MAEWSLTSLYHTVVNCRDLDASVAFYRRLGFEVLNDRRKVVWPDFVAGIFGLRRAQGRGVLMVLPADPNGPMIDLIEWVEPKAEFPDPARRAEAVPRSPPIRRRRRWGSSARPAATIRTATSSS